MTVAVIRDSGAGVVVPTGDPAALLDTAVHLADNVEVGKRLGMSGQHYARRLLSPERALDEYEGRCCRLAGKAAS